MFGWYAYLLDKEKALIKNEFVTIIINQKEAILLQDRIEFKFSKFERKNWKIIYLK